MIERNVVLVDIDHTLSNAFHRDWMIGGEGGWDAYHQASVEDEPIHDTVALVNALSAAGMEIVGITARPAKWRQLTMGWMVSHGIKMDMILMRDDLDYRPAPEIKLALARAAFGPADETIRDHVALVLDDRDDVTQAFRGLGLTVLQVFARQQ